MIRLMLSQLADVTRGELHGCDLAVDEVTEGLGDGFVVLHGLLGKCAVSACLASAGSYE